MTDAAKLPMMLTELRMPTIGRLRQTSRPPPIAKAGSRSLPRSPLRASDSGTLSTAASAAISPSPACSSAKHWRRSTSPPRHRSANLTSRRWRQVATSIEARSNILIFGPSGTSWDGNGEAGTCLYGLDRMPTRGETIFLVIGEDDCHVTWHYGFEAVGVSTPHDFVPDRDDPELEGYDIIALLEPDGDGDALVKCLSLSRHRDRIRASRLNGFASVASAHLHGAELINLLDLGKVNAVALDAFLAERSELDKLKYPERAEILLKAGERHRVTDEVIAVIQRSGALYERGGELVRLCGQIIVPVEDAWLADYLSRHIAFQRIKINGQGMRSAIKPIRRGGCAG